MAHGSRMVGAGRGPGAAEHPPGPKPSLSHEPLTISNRLRIIRLYIIGIIQSFKIPNAQGLKIQDSRIPRFQSSKVPKIQSFKGPKYQQIKSFKF